MTDRPIEDIYPLSPMQSGMLFHALLSPDSEVYVEQTRTTLQGDLNVEAFRQAWQRVMDRHAILRTAFVWEDVEEPLQVVQRKVELPLGVQDLRAMPQDEGVLQIETFSENDRRRGFDLGQAPLLRLTLLRTAEDAWELVWTHHHMLLDGWSLPILLREVFTFYETFSKGKPLALPATRPYRDYIRYLKEQKEADAEAFWRKDLAGYEGWSPLSVERTIREDRPRERNREQELVLGAEATAALQELARNRQLTINTVVGAAWGLMLSRYSGSSDVVFGATVSGRPPALRGAEGMVGLFINTLPVRVKVDEKQPLGEWLAAFQAHQAELRQYEHVPLVKIQAWSDAPRNVPLFDTLMVFENYPTDKALAQQLSPQGGSALRIAGVRSFEQTNYALTFVSGLGAGLVLKISYDPARYDDKTIQRMLGHVRTLLEAMPQSLEQPVGALPMLTAEERGQLLQGWNGEARAVYGADRRIFQLVTEKAAAMPAAPAVVWERGDGQPQSMTYEELDRRASLVAGQLRAAGCGKGDIVAAFMDRSPELVTALLGIMKAGAAYLPLDPAYPPERIAFMLKDSEAAAVVTRGQERAALEAVLGQVGGRAPVLCVDETPSSIDLRDDRQAEDVPAPEDPVYVIYTSGSTGAPKGVVVPHSALSNLAPIVAEHYGITAGDRMLQFISPSFDAAGEEFWPPLISGATIVIPGEERDRLGEPIAAFCERHGVTHLHMASPVWHQWCDDLSASGRMLALPLKTLVVGGEPPSPQRIRAWNELLLAPCRFVNAYGPTETTVTATLHTATSDAPQPDVLPIGKPIANVQVRVVDEQMRWLPQGAAGELLIGGAGVAIGYLGRPELTAERFVELPADDPLGQWCSGSSSVRFYRTGDLVRWEPQTGLTFAGRADDQVKIRGYRVEPGEIEAAIASLPGVAKAAVVAQKAETRSARLVAYVVGRDAVVDAVALAALLRERLPDYMLPAAWVVLPELPLTPTGKLDRRRLPEAETSATRDLEQRPLTADEELLAQLYAALLNIESVGPRDNFFDLGGHSLLATRLASRIREAFGVEVPLRDLLENPTVEGMARVIDAARGQLSPVRSAPFPKLPRGVDGLPCEPPPLSFGQQRLWFLQQLEPGLIAYNTPAAVRMQGELDVDALGRALDGIVRRHEVLRTSFGTLRGEPVQLIAAEQTVELPVEDLTHLPVDEREQEALRRAGEEARRPFDLERGPVLRARLYRLAPEDHIAIITAHHIAADGWSLGILIRELGALYAHYSSGDSATSEAVLPPLPVQYAEYAAWQRQVLAGGGEDGGEQSPPQAQLAYWKQQLAGLPARLDLPTDRPRPAIQSSNGATYSFRLPESLREGLNRVARTEGATLYMVLLAGYQTLLNRYSGQQDIAVGSVVANRTRPELEDLIGFFVNTLVFRTRFDGQPSFRQLLARVRETALGAFTHQDVPFEMLVEAVQPQRDLSHTPLFQAALSLQNLPMPAQELPGLTLRSVEIDRGSAQFDMLLTFTELDEGLGASWEYNSDLFDRSTIERMALNLQTLLEAAIANPDQPVAALPVLSETERALVLDAWNSTAAPFPDDTTIHALIDDWAVKAPDAVAVEYVDMGAGESQSSKLTYVELSRRANQLAHYLRGMGIGPNALVGLSVERSLDMIVGILGVLKAGGAYLPLDPHYPADRLTFMIADSGIEVLLTQEAVLSRLPLAADSAALRVVRLDADWSEIAAQPSETPETEAGPDHLAYCIYTSGSTGKPKGALLRHRGLCNLADVQARAFDMKPDKRVLQFSPFSFDASVWETVMALRSGATLVLARQETLTSGTELLKLLQQARITTVTLPPSLLAVLEPATLPELETVIAAGERCTNEITERWARGRRFFNAYGPTETTVCASMHLCDPDTDYPFGGPPIGSPIANFQCYVVDANLQPQPIGVPGELLVGGVGVAKGYLNRPELTAERFIPYGAFRQRAERSAALSGQRAAAATSPAHKGTLYRTGDLVRWLPNGELEFLGRIDDQVKVRGFRIELGEIESALREHPQVQDAAVTVRGETLAAYFIPRQNESAPSSGVAAAPSPADLRSHLRQRLPEYMVPAVFMALDAFPLSPAGKVDRRALPEPGQVRREAAEYVAPRTPLEESLAALCAELLDVERVGVDDNFFELGGHSLLATRLIARVRDAHQVELPLRTLFEKPTVAGLAQVIEQAQAAPPSTAPQAPAITARSREGRRMSRSALSQDGGDGQGGAA